MRRAFIAVDLEDGVRRRMAGLVEQLARRCPDLPWVRPERMHLTVKFLGQISDEQIAPLDEVLHLLTAAASRFQIVIGGLGAFPPTGRVQVVWVGIADPDSKLGRCRQSCEGLCEALGFPAERRPFRPHLTLARNRVPRRSASIRAALGQQPPFSAGPMWIDHLTLYESVQSKGTREYVPLATRRFQT